MTHIYNKSIATKELVYAKTGVPPEQGVTTGDIYRTEDTGLLLESRGDVTDGKQDFRLSDEGNPKSSLDNGNFNLALIYGWINNNSRYENGDAWVSYDGAKWVVGYLAESHFESDPCDSLVHPEDAIGWVSLLNGSAGGQGVIADGDIAIYEPRNWLHNGVILVKDQLEKFVLTNIPIGQEVEITHEGGRLEKYISGDINDSHSWVDIISTFYIVVTDIGNRAGFEINNIPINRLGITNIGWVKINQPIPFEGEDIAIVITAIDGKATTPILVSGDKEVDTTIYGNGSFMYLSHLAGIRNVILSTTHEP